MPTPAHTPIQVIQAAMGALVFNAFIADAIDANLITPSSFRPEAILKAENYGVIIRKIFSMEEVVLSGRNNLLMALGTAAIATDTALDAVFTKNNKAHDTTPLGSARVIIFQIRCAFAHDPLTPVWRADLDRYKHRYRVIVPVPIESGSTEPRAIEFHPPSLQGKQLSFLDFGGVSGYISLLRYCLEEVAKHPLGNQAYVSPPDQIDTYS